MDDGLIEMVVESVRVHMLSSQPRRDPQGDGPRALSADLDRAVGGERDRDAAPGPHARAAAHPRPLRARRSRRSACRVRGSSSRTSPRRHSTPACSSSGTGATVEIDARAVGRPRLGRPGRGPDLRRPSGARPGRASAPTADDDEASRARTLESTGRGGSPADPRLDVFREFVNSLDVDRAESREGPRPELTPAAPASRRPTPATAHRRRHRRGSARRAQSARPVRPTSPGASRQKSRTARTITCGSRPVGEPAVRG